MLLLILAGGDARAVVHAGRFLAWDNGYHITLFRKVDGNDSALHGMEELDDNIRILWIFPK